MTLATNTFDILMLIARPAAGKSEIIDFLKKTPIQKRIELFHIGEFEEIDDFPMLWTWFEEDDILSDLGYPRLHSDEDHNFLGQHMWDLLIRRIGLEYRKKLRDNPNYHAQKTTIIEFARGKEHGGFSRAFEHLDQVVIDNMAIMYIDVSWEESLRKNRKRFNPNRPDSILEHSLTDQKLELLYRHVDWEELIEGTLEYIQIKNRKVPYVILENENDVTSTGGSILSEHLCLASQILWELYLKNH